jgi:hypothetical protein
MTPARFSEATKSALVSAMEIWGKLPTTPARISVTLLVFVGTAIRYWLGGPQGWEPSLEWLGFLAAMAGIDAVQFYTKRATDASHVAALKGQPPAAAPNG